MKKNVSLPVIQRGAPWSSSKMDKAFQCSLAYKFRYVDKIRSESNTYARVGTAAHRVQELMLEGKTTKEAFAVTYEECDDLTFTEQEKVETFIDAMETFSNKFDKFKRKHNAKEVLLEEQWAINEELQPCDWWDKNAILRGVVDLGMLTGDGSLIVIDHKSGKKRGIDKYNTQLSIYAVLGLAHFPEIKGFQAGVHFISATETVWQDYLTKREIENLIRPWVLEKLENAGELILNPQPREGWWCNWCDYADNCPAKQEI